ncbi:hypothetical protein HYW18_02825 [Candidatus Uhrbacteria bacterium]|nr:hypothetical protein [Candidatus Uhrbacteria bacterium]
MPRTNNIVRDAGIVAMSVLVAVVLAQTGTLEALLTSTQGRIMLGSFLAGLFFVSIFTVAPASVMLVEMALANSVWEVALFGGLGSLVGDLVIFRFMKDSVSSDVRWLLRKTGREKVLALFGIKHVRWLIPFLGALVVISPFPDEIGLAMMGLSNMKTRWFVPITFALDFFGILLIGLVAKHVW